MEISESNCDVITVVVKICYLKFGRPRFPDRCPDKVGRPKNPRELSRMIPGNCGTSHELFAIDGRIAVCTDASSPCSGAPQC